MIGKRQVREDFPLPINGDLDLRFPLPGYPLYEPRGYITYGYVAIVNV